MRHAALAALSALACLVVVSSAASQEAQAYHNARFGYVLEVPQGFTETGDFGIGRGKTYAGGAGVSLSVFGAQNLGGFEAEFAWLVAEKQSQGFGLEATTSTPTWASFTGRTVSRVAELRAIVTCGGASMAIVEMIYLTARRAALQGIVDRLATALRPTGADC